MNNATTTSPLDEKIFHSLKLLSRRGGDYRKDERTFIAETLREAAEAIDLTRSRDHEPTNRIALDAGVLWRLQRFAEGEHAKTVYTLPPNGSYNPLRADIAKLLAVVASSSTPEER